MANPVNNPTTSADKNDLKNHKPYWTGNGYYLKKAGIGRPRKYEEKEVSINLPDKTQGNASSYGSLVTKNAAAAMIEDFYFILSEKLEKLGFDKSQHSQLLNVLFDTFAANTYFGKEALLSLLSQPGCEAIKFYFCMGLNDKPSLVLVGLDADKEEIGMDKGKTITSDLSQEDALHGVDNSLVSRQETMIVEVGGTDLSKVVSINEFLKSTEGKNCRDILAAKLRSNFNNTSPSE